MFNLKKIKYTCTCTRDVFAVDFVGITSDYQLIVQWECSCGKQCAAAVPLEQLTANAPPPPEVPQPTTALTTADREFLRRAHITIQE